MNGTLPLAVVDGVSKIYSGMAAVSFVSFIVSEGERVALAGPSGSGKTTLLYMMAGLIQPDQGSLSIAGKDLAHLSPGKELANLVRIAHQQFDLVPHLPAVQNVLAGRLGQWGLMKSAVSLIWPKEQQLAEAVMAKMGIRDKLHLRTSLLSGGEQQRLAIARLMVQSPRFLLADEPVSSLDPARAEEILELLCGFSDGSGRALVASLHSPELIRKHFSRVIGLRNGGIQFDLSTTHLTQTILDRLYTLEPGSAGETVPADS